MKTISQQKLIVLVSIAFTVFYNNSFFSNTIKIYSLNGLSYLYIFSLATLVTSLSVILLTMISSRYTTKPILICFLIVSSFTWYFMDTYHIIIDDSMIRNSLLSDARESFDLINLKLFVYLLILGILPSIFIYKIKIQYFSIRFEFLNKIKLLCYCWVLVVLLVFASNKFYTSFFREHKHLRFYTNPIYWVYSTLYYIQHSNKNLSFILKEIAPDTKQVKTNSQKKLTLMIVGETARADRFSLNGYKNDTNPLLKNEDLLNFTNMHACGTSTAESVPCMFSVYDKANYNYDKGRTTQNVLDILKSTNNISVLWRDNNSDSKGVAIRVDYEDFRNSNNNPVCDIECRDEGMLSGLNQYISNQNNNDILIVLHQIGSHGPAYYKRYPKRFEKFSPVCKTNEKATFVL